MISLIRNIFQQKPTQAIILMYHRIARPGSDPWDLCVSPENFELQLQALKDSKYSIIPMFRVAERIRQGHSLKNIVALTFDDGYLDNFTEAKPLLEKYKIPAAFYFTTKFQADKRFWWDKLEQLILHTPNLPERINISLNGKIITLLLGEATRLSDEIRAQNARWRYGDAFPNARIKLYYELWAEVKVMSIGQQRAAMHDIMSWAGTSTVLTPPIMNAEQIIEMSNIGLFEIGAHSINHPALGTMPSDEQRTEITESKKALENVVAQTLKGFAYPYGHYNKQTTVLAKAAGFRYALTTAEKPATHNQFVYEIPRYQVKNISGEELIGKIQSWTKN